MSNCLVAASRYMNRLYTGTTTSTIFSNTAHPLSALYDGQGARPAVATSIVTDGHVTNDGNIVLNGDMEAGITNWSSFGPGALTTGTADTGSGGLSIAQGATLSYAYQDREAVAGWEYTVVSRGRRGTGTSGTASMRVYNTATGKYWTGSTWSATPTDAATGISSSTYGTMTATFTIESAILCQAATPKIRIELLRLNNTSTDTAFFDNVAMWPSFDTFAIIGHNIGKEIAPTFRSSTDNFGANNVALTVTQPQSGITIYQPSFWGRCASKSTSRYARILFTGTPSYAMKIGELVITQSNALAKMYDTKPTVEEEELSTYEEGMGGTASAAVIAHWPRGSTEVHFTAETQTQLDSIRWATYYAARGNTYPMLVIPSDSESPVLHARIDASFKYDRDVAIDSGTNAASFGLRFTGTGHYSEFV